MKLKQHTTVKLSNYDWYELINFVKGDLANMEENEIKAQMTRICDTIWGRVAASARKEKP